MPRQGLLCHLHPFPPAANGPLPDKLQQALLPVVDQEHCNQPDWWGGVIRSEMVCAGGDVKAGCNVSPEGGSWGGTCQELLQCHEVPPQVLLTVCRKAGTGPLSQSLRVG